MEALERYEWPVPAAGEPPTPRSCAALYTCRYPLVGGVIGADLRAASPRWAGELLHGMVPRPAFADRMMENDRALRKASSYLDEVRQYLDVVVYWDDVCGQNGWLS
jgi:hypothetical protein